jgi:ligand-binding SRPBCC domain-containing protein
MNVDIETRIEIACPREEVADYASDPDCVTSWYRNIKSVEWQSPKPVRVGSRIAFLANFLGRRLAYVYEVKEIARGERFVMSTADGPFPMETTYTWEDTEGGGTRMTLRNRGEPSGFSKVAAPVMVSAMRRANRNDLARLKTILERRADNSRTDGTPASPGDDEPPGLRAGAGRLH